MTKPSLYRLFGGKERLSLPALARYGSTIGGEPLVAIRAAADVRSAVNALLRTALRGNTAPDLPSGCLFACVAAAVAERMPGVRDR